MYYNKKDILQNYSTKDVLEKLEYEELKDLWWSTFDAICGIEAGDAYSGSELDDLWYIKDECYRQIEARFKDEFKSEFKSYVKEAEESWQEEVDEEGYY